jgi:hypothetical protein
MGRVAHPAEIAGAVELLVSDKAIYMTSTGVDITARLAPARARRLRNAVGE